MLQRDMISEISNISMTAHYMEMYWIQNKTMELSELI